MNNPKSKDFREKLIKRAKESPWIANFEITPDDIESNLMYINKIFKIHDECQSVKDQSLCGSDGYHFRLVKDKANKIVLEPYVCPKILSNKPFLIKQNYLYTSLDITNNNQLLNKSSIIVSENEFDEDRIRFINYLIKIKKRVLTPKGFYVWGENGTGKTYLLIALCNELALLNQKVIYLVMNNFCLEVIQSIRQKKDLSDLFEELKYVDVLVLDEIGTEEYGNYVHNSILYSVLNYRLNTNKLTIFSSKYNLNDLKKNYKVDIKMKNLDNFMNRIENLIEGNVFNLKMKLPK